MSSSNTKMGILTPLLMLVLLMCMFLEFALVNADMSLGPNQACVWCCGCCTSCSNDDDTYGCSNSYGCSCGGCGDCDGCNCGSEQCVLDYNTQKSPICTSSQYTVSQPSSNSLRICADLTTCGPGQYITTPATASSDRVCTNCSGCITDAGCFPFNVSTPTGAWVNTDSSSSGTQTVSLETGTTHATTVGSSSSFGASASQAVANGFTVSVGASILGIGASASDTHTTTDTSSTSQSVSQSFTTAWEQTTIETYSTELPAGVVWQWQWVFDDGNCGSSTVRTRQLTVTPNYLLKPCCLPECFLDSTNPLGACVAAEGQPVFTLCIRTSAPTASPSTDSPTTSTPTTSSPTTSSPTTSSPTTATPTSAAPATSSPTTASPTTASPTTFSPTTASPTTFSPTTASPTTISPTTGSTRSTSISNKANDSSAGLSTKDFVAIIVPGVLIIALLMVIVGYKIRGREAIRQVYECVPTENPAVTLNNC